MNTKIKLFGAGSCLLYAAMDRAKKDQSRNFALYADKDAVDYGIPKGTNNNFLLQNGDYSTVLRKLRKKYSINRIEK